MNIYNVSKKFGLISLLFLLSGNVSMCCGRNFFMETGWGLEKENQNKQERRESCKLEENRCKYISDIRTAFCCASHERLGKDSPARCLPMELFAMICSYVKPTLEEFKKTIGQDSNKIYFIL